MELTEERQKTEGLGSVLVPSVANVIFMVLFCYLSVFIGDSLLGDGDTGYHIRAGEVMMETHAIIRTDPFSHISPPLHWTAHEWLSEIIMAVVHRFFGLTGVVLMFSGLIAATYAYLFTLTRKKGSIIVSAALVALAIASSQIHWLARPHIFSMLLLLLWYEVLDNYQTSGRDMLYMLLPLMVLWVNLHGGFVIGLVLMAVYAAGNAAMGVFGWGDDPLQSRRRAVRIGLFGVLCVAAALLNPYTYRILLFPFNLASSAYLMDNVVEFLSPNFHEPLYYKYFLYVTIALLALSVSRLGLIELMLVIFFTHMSLYAARYMLLSVIITTPILASLAEGILSGSRRGVARMIKVRSERLAAIDGSVQGIFWPAAALLLVLILAGSGRILWSFDEKIKPVRAAEFLEKEFIEGRMFNNDEFGDIIIYLLWPKYKVFIDGRLDMYGEERVKEYFAVARMEKNWGEVLKKYDIDWIIFNAESLLSRYLLERADWKLIYADKVTNIFVKNTDRYRTLIEKYRDAKPLTNKEGKGGS